MIGSMKLCDIKSQLRQALARDRENLEEWLKQQSADLPAKKAQNPDLVVDLMWVRRILCEVNSASRRQAGLPDKP